MTGSSNAYTIHRDRPVLGAAASHETALARRHTIPRRRKRVIHSPLHRP
jgi:hypothetical protein